jgi:DNA mismatch repair protein MutS
MEQTTKQATSVLNYAENLIQTYSEAIILLQVGRFYYTFGTDAQKVVDVLRSPLRHTKKHNISFTDFPASNLDVALPKLIRAGHRVAIAVLPEQQVELPFE